MWQAQHNYRAVLLDWDGTLSTGRFWGHWRHDRPESYDAIGRMFETPDKLIRPWMRGELTAEDAVSVVASTIDCDPSLLWRHLERSCRSMTLSDPGVLAKVRRLRANGVLVGIATDNMDTFTRWTVPALDLDREFDVILSSFDQRCLKADAHPDGSSRFFTDWLAIQGLAPADCLLIDDSAANRSVEGFGLDYARVHTPSDVAPILSNLVISLTR